MKAREFDPRRLDVRAVAKAGAELAGEWPLAGFERLRASLAAANDAMPAGAVRWTARGELVPVRGGVAQVWLHLRAAAELPLQCQRCLEPVVEPVALARDFQFVADESTAAELDAEVEHEVLVLARELDLHALLEDELLLDLPLVPRHQACPQPLPSADAEPAVAAGHPFAALSAWRRGPSMG
jgi:uncharacterized protein